MTIRRVFTAGSNTYTAVLDGTPTLDAIVTGRALDELTGLPPTEPVRVTGLLRRIAPPSPADSARLVSVSGIGGTFAMTGLPAELFPNLAVASYALDLSVGADGYLTTPANVPVPAATPDFPVGPITVLLRRPAIRLRGQVVAAGVVALPINGAHVNVFDPLNQVGFSTPFAFGHAAPTALAPLLLTTVPPNLPLLAGVVPGDVAIELANRTGLAANAVLALGQGAEREYCIVDSVEGPANPTLAGRALLRTPPSFPHPQSGPPALRAVPGPMGPAPRLTRDSFATDRVAFVDDASLLTSGEVVRVMDGDPLHVEYLVALRQEGLTDASGYYHLGPVGRSRTFGVRFTPPVGPAVDATWIARYDQPDNVVNGRI